MCNNNSSHSYHWYRCITFWSQGEKCWTLLCGQQTPGSVSSCNLHADDLGVFNWCLRYDGGDVLFWHAGLREELGITFHTSTNAADFASDAPIEADQHFGGVFCVCLSNDFTVLVVTSQAMHASFLNTSTSDIISCTLILLFSVYTAALPFWNTSSFQCDSICLIHGKEVFLLRLQNKHVVKNNHTIPMAVFSSTFRFCWVLFYYMDHRQHWKQVIYFLEYCTLLLETN